MHMSDVLLSPVVGVTMLGVTAGCTAISISRLNQEYNAMPLEVHPTFPSASSRVPLMGIMAAFVFAAQMINFSIPGTGSSGHIGGGLLLAAILGPWAGFLSISTVLIIQAFFFADGGLLALGANIFNLGFFPCFLAYPLLFQTILGQKRQVQHSRMRLLLASAISVVVSLQMGSFSVVLQTMLSGKTALPFGTFLLYMQPIHLVIGLVEGFITAAVLLFVQQYQPNLLHFSSADDEISPATKHTKWVPIVLLCFALALGGVGSWFASADPDGLEWSIEKTAGTLEMTANSTTHSQLADLQAQIALMPEYDFKSGSANGMPFGSTASGIMGIAFILFVMVVLGIGIRSIRKRTNTPQNSDH